MSRVRTRRKNCDERSKSQCAKQLWCGHRWLHRHFRQHGNQKFVALILSTVEFAAVPLTATGRRAWLPRYAAPSPAKPVIEQGSRQMVASLCRRRRDCLRREGSALPIQGDGFDRKIKPSSSVPRRESTCASAMARGQTSGQVEPLAPDFLHRAVRLALPPTNEVGHFPTGQTRTTSDENRLAHLRAPQRARTSA